MNRFILIPAFLSILSFVGCRFFDSDDSVEIDWVEDLQGDFEFVNNWSYPEGVFMNDFGQLSCDGLCPPETDAMKDENGRIFNDSLSRFYSLVDTAHQHYSIESETNSYEWMGTNFLDARRLDDGMVLCATLRNVATHSDLVLAFEEDKCFALINYHSVATSDVKIYHCNGGKITIDKQLWDEGILKAEFDLTFENTDVSNNELFWKGKIYTTIE